MGKENPRKSASVNCRHTCGDLAHIGCSPLSPPLSKLAALRGCPYIGGRRGDTPMTRRAMFGMASVAVLGALLCATLLLAKHGVVVTNDGTRYEGEGAEGDADVTVTIHGVKTTIKRENIASINYNENFDKEYADRLAKLDAKDAAGRIQLARWAMDQGHYDKARDAADQALAIDPNSREATDLQTVI